MTAKSIIVLSLMRFEEDYGWAGFTPSHFLFHFPFLRWMTILLLMLGILEVKLTSMVSGLTNIRL
jgi:hypothetical protein